MLAYAEKIDGDENCRYVRKYRCDKSYSLLSALHKAREYGHFFCVGIDEKGYYQNGENIRAGVQPCFPFFAPILFCAIRVSFRSPSPTAADARVERRVGKMMSEADAEAAELRRAITVVGKSWTEVTLRIRNFIMS